MMFKSSDSDQIQGFLESVYAQRWCQRCLIVHRANKKWLQPAIAHITN